MSVGGLLMIGNCDRAVLLAVVAMPRWLQFADSADEVCSSPEKPAILTAGCIQATEFMERRGIKPRDSRSRSYTCRTASKPSSPWVWLSWSQHAHNRKSPHQLKSMWLSKSRPQSTNIFSGRAAPAPTPHCPDRGQHFEFRKNPVELALRPDVRGVLAC